MSSTHQSSKVSRDQPTTRFHSCGTQTSPTDPTALEISAPLNLACFWWPGHSLWNTSSRTHFPHHSLLWPQTTSHVFSSNGGLAVPVQITLSPTHSFTSLLFIPSYWEARVQNHLVIRNGKLKCWPGQGGDRTARSCCMTKERCGLGIGTHNKQAAACFQVPATDQKTAAPEGAWREVKDWTGEECPQMNLGREKRTEKKTTELAGVWAQRSHY